jgi:hypothetical protein
VKTSKLFSQKNFSLGQDESHGNDGLTLFELKDALQEFSQIELIIFDACLMASIEVVYELRHLSRYIMASQGYLPASGLNYTILLESLNHTESDIKTATLDFLQRFVAYNKSLPTEKGKGTLSLIQTSGLEPLPALIATTNLSMGNDKAVLATGLPVINIERSELRDLGGFLEKLPLDSSIREKMNQAIVNTVLFHYHSDEGVKIASYAPLSGLNITIFELNENLNSQKNHYNQLEFVQDVRWQMF